MARVEKGRMTAKSELKGGRAIVVVLRYGSLLGTLVMAAGVVLALVRGTPVGPGDSRPIHFDLLLWRLLRLEPLAIIESGVLMLLFTPIARIVAAVIGFALERDLKYVLISLGVLAVVLLSISFAIEA